MNRNSEAPASTSTLCAAGTHSGKPEATAMAPYDRPMNKTARQVRAMSRSTPRPRVLPIELTKLILNTNLSFVKTNG